ncbi:MAG: hypothetical protein QOK40_3485, partial [Miltoncostaeaceae bacterium]|nr:hypothetical protein [Miltoncostaeaceae bacterium]
MGAPAAALSHLTPGGQKRGPTLPLPGASERGHDIAACDRTGRHAGVRAGGER